MSTAGLSVFWVVLVALELDSAKTITRPSVMLVMYAPSRYPSISFVGLSSSSITVVAAISVGFNDAVSDRRVTWLIAVHRPPPARAARWSGRCRFRGWKRA